ncbi:MAG: hypothetical protein ACT4RN_13265 [Pseudonocardia sp.]
MTVPGDAEAAESHLLRRRLERLLAVKRPANTFRTGLAIGC